MPLVLKNVVKRVGAETRAHLALEDGRHVGLPKACHRVERPLVPAVADDEGLDDGESTVRAHVDFGLAE